MNEACAKIVDVKKENAVISCLLNDSSLFFDTDIIETDFYNSLNKDIFSILREISKRHEKKNSELLDFSVLNIQNTAKLLNVDLEPKHIKDIRDLCGENG